MDPYHKANVCLGIPVPRCLRELLNVPSVCFSTLGDLLALDLLRDFEKEFTIIPAEIAQAYNLASGPSDIVIILKKPRRKITYNYHDRFKHFVYQFHTLQAVNELIRLVTNGARNIHTVTVLNAFSYKLTEDVHTPDEKCH